MATRKIRYTGPQAEREIAATGQVVQQNHQVEVDEELAKALNQQDVWEYVKDESKKGKE